MKKKPLEGTPIIKLSCKLFGVQGEGTHLLGVQTQYLQKTKFFVPPKACKTKFCTQRGSNFVFACKTPFCKQLCCVAKAKLLQVTQVALRQAPRHTENYSLQLKKIVSGEISKTPFLDILLTDLEQSSFSLIRRNEIEPKKCNKLHIIPPIFLLSRKDSLSLKAFLHRKAYLQKTKSSKFFNEKVFKAFIKSSQALIENKKKYKVATKRVYKQEVKLLQGTKLSFAVQWGSTTLQKPSDAKTNLLQFCNTSFVQSLRKKASFLRDASFLRMEGTKFNPIHKDCLQERSFCTALCQVKTGDYVHCGDKIGNISGTPIVISESGKILKINPWQVTIQKMQPVLFYSQAEIHVESDEWVKRGTPILTLAHQTLVTGDIVQGIPRIEQLFEASTSTPPGAALQDFGSYSENDSSTKSLENIYDYLHGEGSKGAFPKLQPQPTNPTQAYRWNPTSKSEKVTKNTTQASRQTKSASTFTVNSNVEEKPLLLYKTLQSQVRELFRKKWNLLPLPVAVRQSLEEIQQIIVESIQKVYLSQGVLIADKHIEIIVRQMTSKAQIFDGGNTGLLIDEILSLQQIENANISTPGQKALYLPVILGLTRAALSSDSFVSAASFQETTRVLSRDAVAGKSDFLRGLKEKVIIGDLIDAGTGLDVFYVYSLFSKKIFENKFFPNDDLKVTHKMLRKLVKRAAK